MLPLDISRCPGAGTEQGKPEVRCLDCARRTAGLADYMAGRVVSWLLPAPTEVPCPMWMEERK